MEKKKEVKQQPTRWRNVILSDLFVQVPSTWLYLSKQVGGVGLFKFVPVCSAPTDMQSRVFCSPAGRLPTASLEPVLQSRRGPFSFQCKTLADRIGTYIYCYSINYRLVFLKYVFILSLLFIWLFIYAICY